MVRAVVGTALVALCVTLLAPIEARAQSAPVACGTDPPPAVMQSARQHFDTGRSLVSAGAFDHAERELRAALELYDSPNTHYWLGRALEGLGRNADAFAAFDHTILLAARCTAAERQAGRQDRYAETIRLATEQRERLRTSLASLRIAARTADGAVTPTVRVDGVPVDDASRSLVRSAGTHEIIVDAPGYRSQTRRVELAAGRESTIEITVARDRERTRCETDPTDPSCGLPREIAPVRSPPGRSNGLLIGGIVTLGVGAASGAVGIALWASARGEYAELDRACGQSGCDNASVALRARVDAAQTLETIGLALGWGGLAAGALGASLVIGDRVAHSRERARVAVSLGPQSIALSGSF